MKLVFWMLVAVLLALAVLGAFWYDMRHAALHHAVLQPGLQPELQPGLVAAAAVFCRPARVRCVPGLRGPGGVS